MDLVGSTDREELAIARFRSSLIVVQEAIPLERGKKKKPVGDLSGNLPPNDLITLPSWSLLLTENDVNDGKSYWLAEPCVHMLV